MCRGFRVEACLFWFFSVYTDFRGNISEYMLSVQLGRLFRVWGSGIKSNRGSARVLLRLGQRTDLMIEAYPKP